MARSFQTPRKKKTSPKRPKPTFNKDEGKKKASGDKGTAHPPSSGASFSGSTLTNYARDDVKPNLSDNVEGCSTFESEGETQAFIPLSQTLDTETKEEDNQKSVQWYRSTTKPKPTNNEGNLRKPEFPRRLPSRTMSLPPHNQWNVILADLPQFRSRQRKRYICEYCHRPGHNKKQCMLVEQMCELCSEPGHSYKYCRMKLNGEYWTLGQFNKVRTAIKCRICNKADHGIKYCPNKWRTLHNTTASSDTLKMLDLSDQIKSSKQYCYNCGKEGHLGNECRDITPKMRSCVLLPLVSTYRHVKFNPKSYYMPKLPSSTQSKQEWSTGGHRSKSLCIDLTTAGEQGSPILQDLIGPGRSREEQGSTSTTAKLATYSMLPFSKQSTITGTALEESHLKTVQIEPWSPHSSKPEGLANQISSRDPFEDGPSHTSTASSGDVGKPHNIAIQEPSPSQVQPHAIGAMVGNQGLKDSLGSIGLLTNDPTTAVPRPVDPMNPDRIHLASQAQTATTVSLSPPQVVGIKRPHSPTEDEDNLHKSAKLLSQTRELLNKMQHRSMRGKELLKDLKAVAEESYLAVQRITQMANNCEPSELHQKQDYQSEGSITCPQIAYSPEVDKRGESSDLSVGSRDYGEPVKEPKNELRGSFTSESKENAPSIDPDREVYIVLDEASEGTPECIQCNCADCIVKDIFRQRSPPPKAYLQKLSSQPIANMQEIDQRLEVTPGQKKDLNCISLLVPKRALPCIPARFNTKNPLEQLPIALTYWKCLEDESRQKSYLLYDIPYWVFLTEKLISLHENLSLKESRLVKDSPAVESSKNLRELLQDMAVLLLLYINFASYQHYKNWMLNWLGFATLKTNLKDCIKKIEVFPIDEVTRIFSILPGSKCQHRGKESKSKTPEITSSAMLEVRTNTHVRKEGNEVFLLEEAAINLVRAIDAYLVYPKMDLEALKNRLLSLGVIDKLSSKGLFSALAEAHSKSDSSDFSTAMNRHPGLIDRIANFQMEVDVAVRQLTGERNARLLSIISRSPKLRCGDMLYSLDTFICLISAKLDKKRFLLPMPRQRTALDGHAAIGSEVSISRVDESGNPLSKSAQKKKNKIEKGKKKKKMRRLQQRQEPTSMTFPSPSILSYGKPKILPMEVWPYPLNSGEEFQPSDDGSYGPYSNNNTRASAHSYNIKPFGLSGGFTYASDSEVQVRNQPAWKDYPLEDFLQRHPKGKKRRFKHERHTGAKSKFVSVTKIKYNLRSFTKLHEEI